MKKGDVLIVIDPRPFVAELNRAKAQLEASQGDVYTVHNTARRSAGPGEPSQLRASTIPSDVLARSREVTSGRRQLPRTNLSLQKSELLARSSGFAGARATVASSQAAIGTAKAAVQSAAGCRRACGIKPGIHERHRTCRRPNQPRNWSPKGNLVQSGETRRHRAHHIVSVDPIYAYFDMDEHTVLRVRQLIRDGKAESARDSRDAGYA